MRSTDNVYFKFIFSKEKTSAQDRINIVLLLIGLVFSKAAFSQNVGINATGAVPNAAAMLDIASTNKGLLIPRLALTGINSNAPVGASVIASLLVYNTATAGITPNNVVPGYYYWDGTEWVALAGDGSKNWSLTGNSATVDGTHFIGTSDNVPLNFRVNNITAGRIDHILGNSFFGSQSGNANASGYGNTAYGFYSLLSNTGGNYNTAIGVQALATNTAGNNNTAVGRQALYLNTTGSDNTSCGVNALYANTSPSFNSAFGSYALYGNTSGSENCAAGSAALFTNTTGFQNTGIGRQALYQNSSGYRNTAVGFNALNKNNLGYKNTAVGDSCLYSNLIGYTNSAHGACALNKNTIGSQNTAMGVYALTSVTTGSNNSGFGYNANVPNATASNQVRVGNTAITYAGIQVAWTITSDKRWKTDIKPSNLGLNFIKALRPVSYVRLNDDAKKTEYGFIAQEVETLLNTSGAANSGIITKDDEGMLSMRYNDLIAPMVKALQEQQDMIEELRLKNKDLEARLKALEKK
jgi:hypothetical protein